MQLDHGYEERTQWHRLTLWDRLPQTAEEYIRKGDRVYVEGRIEYGSFTKDDGTVVPTSEIVVSELILLGSPAAWASEPQPQQRGPREQRRRSGADQ